MINGRLNNWTTKLWEWRIISMKNTPMLVFKLSLFFFIIKQIFQGYHWKLFLHIICRNRCCIHLCWKGIIRAKLLFDDQSFYAVYFTPFSTCFFYILLFFGSLAVARKLFWSFFCVTAGFLEEEKFAPKMAKTCSKWAKKELLEFIEKLGHWFSQTNGSLYYLLYSCNNLVPRKSLVPVILVKMLAAKQIARFSNLTVSLEWIG